MEYREFYSYLVFENGSVYSLKSKRFLKGEITKHGYLQYTLSFQGSQKRIRANRLVAFLFLKEEEGKPIVNHKDGNKLNNHYSNLEWCTHEYNNRHARIMKLNDVSKSNRERWKDSKFRERVSKKISKTLKEKGICKGSNNPKFRYFIYADGIEISRSELADIINLSMSRTDVLIREFTQGKNNKYFIENKITIIDKNLKSID